MKVRSSVKKICVKCKVVRRHGVVRIIWRETMDSRTERDILGERAVPADAYFGIHTVRAVENFPISGLRAHPALIVATAQVKLAAAQANVALGRSAPPSAMRSWRRPATSSSAGFTTSSWWTHSRPGPELPTT